MKQVSLQEEDMLLEKVKEFPVLQRKTDGGYKERNVVRNAWEAVEEDLDFVENGKFCTPVLFYDYSLILGGSKRSYILKQTCNFLLHVILSIYDLLLPQDNKG